MTTCQQTSRYQYDLKMKMMVKVVMKKYIFFRIETVMLQ